jgi:hypothetical protein
VLGDQVAHIDTADLERTLVVLAGRAGPEQRHELVDVGELLQPGRSAGSLGVRPAGFVGVHHMRSGALTPSRPRPLASTTRVAATRSRRARWIGAGSSSPMGSTRQES